MSEDFQTAVYLDRRERDEIAAEHAAEVDAAWGAPSDDEITVRDLDVEEAALVEDLWAREWAAEDDLERYADAARDEYAHELYGDVA